MSSHTLKSKNNVPSLNFLNFSFNCSRDDISYTVQETIANQ